MSMITKLVERLREAANIWCEFNVSDLLNEAADTIEQLAAKVREDNAYQKAFEYIKAEITEEKECAYADFERYKVEYLGQDWEDALDSLPHDDFRYGMERCLEIISKHNPYTVGRERA